MAAELPSVFLEGTSYTALEQSGLHQDFPWRPRFIPHINTLYTTKHISTQCCRIFKQISLRWEMHTAGTVFSRAGAEGASTDFWKPWIICHFPCSVAERPLCFPPPASFLPSLLSPFPQLSWVISKENRELFLLSIPPTPPCFS